MIITGPRVVEWVAKRIDGSFGAAEGIGVELDGQLIGGVAYSDYTGPNVCMHTAAVPGAPWLTRRTLWRFFHYPFIEIECNRVTALVGAGNAKSRKLIEGVGFKWEAALEGAHPTGDLIVYRMWKSECRYLQRNRNELKAA